jgi:hypothetical protein
MSLVSPREPHNKLSGISSTRNDKLSGESEHWFER